MLGANDGLVSVASIMLGVGAGNVDQKTLILSGTSALVAGTALFDTHSLRPYDGCSSGLGDLRAHL